MAERSNAILSWTAPAIRPLFVPNEEGAPVHIGSGVLLRVHDTCFIVTAGHVLDAAPGDVLLYVGTPRQLVEAPGERFYTKPPLGFRSSDRIDVGFVPLERSTVAEMSDCRFLSTDEIDVDDLADYKPVFGSKYLAMGYPHMLVTLPKERNTFAARLISWTGKPRTVATFPELKLLEASHVMLDFDAERIGHELALKAPFDPTGMSGGALFRFGSLVRGSSTDDKLVGIIVEKHLDKYGCILASRLSFVIEGIRAKFPDLDQFLPQSLNLRVRYTERTGQSKS